MRCSEPVERAETLYGSSIWTAAFAPSEEEAHSRCRTLFVAALIFDKKEGRRRGRRLGTKGGGRSKTAGGVVLEGISLAVVPASALMAFLLLGGPSSWPGCAPMKEKAAASWGSE